MSTNDSVREVLDAYVEHLGIRRREFVKCEEPLWDGEAMAILSDAADVAHELAHWLLCDEERRGVQNFGWFSDYQYSDLNETVIDEHPEWGRWADYNNHDEEVEACVLGFALLVRCGYDPTTHWVDYCFTTWNEELDRECLDSPSLIASIRRSLQPQVVKFLQWKESYAPANHPSSDGRYSV